MKLCLLGSLAFALGIVASMVGAQPADDVAMAAKVAQGNRLAAVLRAGRSVISENQDLINNAELGDKGLTGSAVIEQVQVLYQARHGMVVLDEGLNEIERLLIETQLQSMYEIVEENQTLINSEGIGFKGFIPATFARLVNERFAEKLDGSARVKVTAPVELVRNRTARPDKWESTVIEQRFQSEDWVEGAPFYELTELDGAPAFRMILPEYYSQSCLSCHGGPEGETDLTGFPKEGGQQGELGGAISIILSEW